MAPARLLRAAGALACLAGAVVSCGGRIYTSPRLHVGVRPAVFEAPMGEWAVGVTVQVRMEMP